MLEGLAIYCADVGSIANNFGWARVDVDDDNVGTGTRIDDLAARLATDLAAGRRVALGFECPLWIPIPPKSALLGKARPGEAGPGRRARPWSAAAGGGSLVAGLAQVPWILEAIRPVGERNPSATTDWRTFASGAARLFVWEAMVTDAAKGESHEEDALIGARAFKATLPDPRVDDTCQPDGPVYSLAGAALLRAGWSSEPDLLRQPCIVIRAK